MDKTGHKQLNGKQIDINATPVFLRNYQSTKYIKLNRGGSSSSKTYSILQLLLNWLFTGHAGEGLYIPTGTCSIVRKYGANLRASVQRDLENLLTSMSLWEYVERNKSDKTYRHNGRIIELIGIDDPQKARGPRRELLYCNEANEITPEDFFQLSIRTTHTIFVDFNPSDEDVWINDELEKRRANDEKDVDLIVSTYRDNPFLFEKVRKQLDKLKETNPAYYRIYGLGEYGRLDGLVFPTFDEIDEVPKGAKYLAHGLDFGFTNDPTALVAGYLHDGALIFDEILYQTQLTNQDIVAKLKVLGYTKENTEIIADSAEPKSIEEIYRAGFDIKGADKGPDSIKFGIDIMNQYPIKITKRSANLKKELKKYVWAMDKNGKTLNKPQAGQDHILDGCRYLSMAKLKKQEVKTVFVGTV